MPCSENGGRRRYYCTPSRLLFFSNRAVGNYDEVIPEYKKAGGLGSKKQLRRVLSWTLPPPIAFFAFLRFLFFFALYSLFRTVPLVFWPFFRLVHLYIL